MPTNPPTITALPTPPDPNDRSSFNVRAYPWSVAQQTLATEVAAVAANVKGNADEAVSAAQTASNAAAEGMHARDAAEQAAISALLAPGSFSTCPDAIYMEEGEIEFTTQPGKIYPTGANVVIALTADPTIQMGAIVNTYHPVSGNMNCTVVSKTATGEYSGWTISIGLAAGRRLPTITGADVGRLVGVVAGPTYGLVEGRGAGGATAPAGNVTLTATSSAAQKLTASATPLPMQWVKLPDATTMGAGVGLFSLENATGVEVEVRNATGAAIGYIRPNATINVNLQDNSTTAGVWSLPGAAMWGTLHSSIALPNNTAKLESVLAIDSTRDLVVISHASGVSAVVWSAESCSFGTPVLVSTVTPLSPTGVPGARIVKLAPDKMFVGIVNGTASGVVLTASGTTITAGTPGASSNQGYDRMVDMILLDNGTVVYVLSTASPFLYNVAAAINGSAVTFGTATQPFGSANFPTTNTAAMFDLSGGRFLLVGLTGNYAVVGTVTAAGAISYGTVTSPTSAVLQWSLRRLPSGRFALIGINGHVYGNILTVAGTTITVSTVILLNGLDRFYTAHVVGNQVIVAGAMSSTANSLYFNVLTDNAGTAVAGTALARFNISGGTIASPISFLGYDSVSVTCVKREGGSGSMGDCQILRVGISGNNPALWASRGFYSGDVSTGSGVPVPSDGGVSSGTAFGCVYGKDTLPLGVIAGSRASIDISSTGGLAWQIDGAHASIINRPLMVYFYPFGGRVSVGGRGGIDSQQWASQGSANGSYVNIQRVKVV